MTRQVNLYEAKTHLSRLVEDASKGDTIIIAKDGKPMAKLGPANDAVGKQPRKLGQFASHAKGVDWRQWWRDWKTADKEIEAEFQAAAEKPFVSPRLNRRKKH